MPCPGRGESVAELQHWRVSCELRRQLGQLGLVLGDLWRRHAVTLVQHQYGGLERRLVVRSVGGGESVAEL